MTIELRHLLDRFTNLQQDIDFLQYLTIMYTEQKDADIEKLRVRDNNTAKELTDEIIREEQAKAVKTVLYSVYNLLMKNIQHDPNKAFNNGLDERGIQRIIAGLDNIASAYHTGPIFENKGEENG